MHSKHHVLVQWWPKIHIQTLSLRIEEFKNIQKEGMEEALCKRKNQHPFVKLIYFSVDVSRTTKLKIFLSRFMMYTSHSTQAHLDGHYYLYIAVLYIVLCSYSEVEKHLDSTI